MQVCFSFKGKVVIGFFLLMLLCLCGEIEQKCTFEIKKKGNEKKPPLKVEGLK